MITGNLQSKANSRRVTGSGLVIKSKKAMEWLQEAESQLKTQWDGIMLGSDKSVPFNERNVLAVSAAVYYATGMSDADVSLLWDFLVKQGVILDDNLIRHSLVVSYISPTPRVELAIEVLTRTIKDYRTYVRPAKPKRKRPSKGIQLVLDGT